MFPIEMTYSDYSANVEFNVMVYQFITVSLTEVYALCWNKKDNNWLTIAVHLLRPIIRKDLNE